MCMLICIYMLTKRTNILFDQDTWDYLVGLAQNNDSSVGELIRTAVYKIYLDKEDHINQQKSEGVNQINQIRASIKHKFSTKELSVSIDYGRKY